jgi:uncharacterized membrane protein YidH (DUF202 family)
VRLIAFTEYAAVIIGVIAVIAGRFFALAKGFHLGVFMIGAGIALGGLEAVLTRRMFFRTSEDAYETYAGAPAFIVGAMALLIGSGVIAAAYLLADGQWHATLNYLARRPAPVLIAAGLLLAGLGALMMLNPQGRTGLAWTVLVHIPRSLAGFVLVVCGLTAIGLGMWEWLQPLAFDGFVRKLPKTIYWPRIPLPRN